MTRKEYLELADRKLKAFDHCQVMKGKWLFLQHSIWQGETGLQAALDSAYLGIRQAVREYREVSTLSDSAWREYRSYLLDGVTE